MKLLMDSFATLVGFTNYALSLMTNVSLTLGMEEKLKINLKV